MAAKVDNPIWPRSPTPITTEPPQPLLLTGQSCAFFQQPLLCFFLPFLPKCSRRDIHSYRCVSIVSVLRAKGNAARGLSSTQAAQISLHIGPIPPQLQPTQPNSTPTSPTHTFYLSQTPQTVSVQKKLPGVNFYRFNAKNWQFTVYFAVITQKIGIFDRFNAKNWRFLV